MKDGNLILLKKFNEDDYNMKVINQPSCPIFRQKKKKILKRRWFKKVGFLQVSDIMEKSSP